MTQAHVDSLWTLCQNRQTHSQPGLTFMGCKSGHMKPAPTRGGKGKARAGGYVEVEEDDNGEAGLQEENMPEDNGLEEEEEDEDENEDEDEEEEQQQQQVLPPGSPLANNGTQKARKLFLRSLSTDSLYLQLVSKMTTKVCAALF